MAISTALEHTLTARVTDYSARVRDDVLDQHEGSVVHSPLGVWLLLCVCLSAAEGSDRVELEAAVGSSQAEARELLHGFLENVPPAIMAALAVWTRTQGASERLRAWLDGLPVSIGRGPVPTKAAADTWASDHTSGLIQMFPIDPGGFDLLVVSALATQVSWQNPYEVRSAAESFSPSSPWVGAVNHVLWMDRPPHSAIIDTAAAGVVAVHRAVAKEDLVVICVSADSAVPRPQVLAAAHEVNGYLAATNSVEQRSLFDLPLGPGHSWIIEEQGERPPTGGTALSASVMSLFPPGRSTASSSSQTCPHRVQPSRWALW